MADYQLTYHLVTEQAADGTWSAALVARCETQPDEVMATSRTCPTEMEALVDVRDGFNDLVRMLLSNPY